MSFINKKTVKGIPLHLRLRVGVTYREGPLWICENSAIACLGFSDHFDLRVTAVTAVSVAPDPSNAASAALRPI